MILVVESILKLPYALDRSIDLVVPTKDQKDRVGFSELRVEGSDRHLYGFIRFVSSMGTQTPGSWAHLRSQLSRSSLLTGVVGFRDQFTTVRRRVIDTLLHSRLYPPL
jgi:hypothetical protein